MSRVTDALDRLMAEHRRLGSPLPEYLRPGLDARDVGRLIVAAVGHDPPVDLIELFAWHDGVDNEAWERNGTATGFARLFGDAHFAPLADAVREYHERIQTDEVTAHYGPAGGETRTWGQSWFPAFCLGWDTYAVECDPGRHDLGRIFDPAWEAPTEVGPGPRFRDLQHLVDSAIRRFEAGGYSWDTKTRFLEEHRDVLLPLYEREIAEARA